MDLAKVKQEISEAIWREEIDQQTTAEVADLFGLNVAQTRRVLMAIVSRKFTPEGFCFESSNHWNDGVKAIYTKNRKTFTYSDDLDFQEGRQSHNHFIWYLS